MSITVSEGTDSTWSLTTITATEIITAALREINAIGQGESISSTDTSFGLGKLNRMIDQWWANREYVHYREIVSYAWTTSQTSYTIGLSGYDFTGNKPIKIEAANLIRTGSDPDEHVPINVWEVDEYFSIPYPATSAVEPIGIYYQPAAAYGTIYPYPYPENTATALANKLELLIWAQLSKFDTASTAVSLAPGYEEAIILSLAEKLCSSFEKEPPRSLSIEAGRARALLTSLNMNSPKYGTRDSGIPTAEAW